MKDRLTKEEVLHVANLARISLTEEEVEKYQVQLKKLLDDVEKINQVEAYGYDDDWFYIGSDGNRLFNSINIESAIKIQL